MVYLAQRYGKGFIWRHDFSNQDNLGLGSSSRDIVTYTHLLGKNLSAV